jgi:hypothetical protein
MAPEFTPVFGVMAPLLRRNTAISCALFNFERNFVMARSAFFFKLQHRGFSWCNDQPLRGTDNIVGVLGKADGGIRSSQKNIENGSSRVNGNHS